MKKIVLLLIICFYQVESQVTFQKTYGTSQSETVNSTEVTFDRGYISAGQKMYTSALNTFYGYLQKTDSVGSLIWAKRYTIPGFGFFTNSFETKDKGFIVSGNTRDSAGIAKDMFLLKTDSLGNVLWAKSYGGSSSDAMCYVIQTSDSGFVMLGETYSVAGQNDIYIVKTDKLGTVQWAHTYGGTSWEKNVSINQTSDGGYYTVGTTSSFNSLNSDIYAIKLDASGNVAWSKIYGETQTDVGEIGLQTLDGGFLIVSKTLNYDISTWKIGLIKTNDLGDTLWTRTYKKVGATELTAWGAEQTKDGNYVLVGYLQSTPGYYKGYILKVDSIGNYMWAYSYTSNQYLYTIRETPDTGLIISSVSGGGFGMGNNDVLLIKTNSNGNSGCYQNADIPISGHSAPKTSNVTTLTSTGCATQNITITESANQNYMLNICSFIPTKLESYSHPNTLNVFPNPANKQLFIDANTTDKLTVDLYDFTGKQVFSKSTNDKSVIELSDLTKGIYILNIKTVDHIITKKIVISP